jgi:hypothetical protein
LNTGQKESNSEVGNATLGMSLVLARDLKHFRNGESLVSRLVGHHLRCYFCPFVCRLLKTIYVDHVLWHAGGLLFVIEVSMVVTHNRSVEHIAGYNCLPHIVRHV